MFKKVFIFLSLFLSHFIISSTGGCDEKKLALPEGFSTAQTLFLQIRADIISKVADLYKNYPYRVGLQDVRFLENHIDQCGSALDSSQTLLEFKFLHFKNDLQKSETIESIGCQGTPLFTESVVFSGTSLEETVLSLLAQGIFSDFMSEVNPESENQPQAIHYTLSILGNELIEIKQKRSESTLVTEFYLYKVLFAKMVDHTVDEKKRKIEWIFNGSGSVKLPVIQYTHKMNLPYKLPTFGLGSQRMEMELLLMDQGLLLPLEEYRVNKKKSTRKAVVDQLNGSIYSILNSMKREIYQKLIVDYSLPRTEVLKSAGEPMILTEINEMLRFLDQNTPASIQRVKIKLLEIANALRDGKMSVNDKRE